MLPHYKANQLRIFSRRFHCKKFFQNLCLVKTVQLCKEQVIDKSGLFCEILEVFRTLNISITQEAFFICSQKNSTMTIDNILEFLTLFLLLLKNVILFVWRKILQRK
jgi:hypothetical protein